MTCIQNLRAVTKKFRLESYFSSLMVFIICHSSQKEGALNIAPCFYAEKCVAKRPPLSCDRKLTKIALKNLVQEEQLPRHHLNSACDFIYAVFVQTLGQVRRFVSQLRFTSSNIGEYCPTLNSVAV